ncbi:MAG: hypothetical protein R3233_07240 [Xanthomonadales bacterium]|nr:hypothetical protein [Xanthomonadales bacterium]
MTRILTAGAAAALIALWFCAPLAAEQNAEPAPEAASQAGASAPQQDAAPGQPPQPAQAKPPEDPAELEEKSRQAYAAGEYLPFYIANLKLHKMFPYVPQYLVNLVRASALLEKYNTAYHYMYTMQQQGLSFDFNSTEDTERIRGTQAYDYLNNLMIEAGKTNGAGTVVATLPGSPQDYAAIAWDPTRDRLLVGTVVEGRLLALAADGSVETLLEASDANGLWSLTGLAVNPETNRLWVATTALPEYGKLSPADRNRSALVELELDSLEIVGRSYVPVGARPHALGSVAVTADDHVYAIDTLAPVVFRKAPGEDRLEAFVSSDRLVGFTDIAVVPDNSRLFVADPVVGVFLVDPRGKNAALLGGPDSLNLGGIDGIAYADHQLFIVQGGISPQRILRLELDDAGAQVASVSPMAIALEPFNWPRLAAVQGADLVYLANQGGGDAADGAIVMHTPLDAGAALEAPDAEDLKRALQAQPPQQPPRQ